MTGSPPPTKGRGAVSNRTGRFEALQREAVDDGWSHPESEPDTPATERGPRAMGDAAPRTPAERREQIRLAMRESLAELSPPPSSEANREAREADATERRDSAVPRSLARPLTVPGVYDLPADVRAALPNIDVTVHVYARDPAGRAVQINGKMLGEGDAITPELRLVQITRRGVVLEVGGNRFQMGVQEEWWAQ